MGLQHCHITRSPVRYWHQSASSRQDGFRAQGSRAPNRSFQFGNRLARYERRCWKQNINYITVVPRYFQSHLPFPHLGNIFCTTRKSRWFVQRYWRTVTVTRTERHANFVRSTLGWVRLHSTFTQWALHSHWSVSHWCHPTHSVQIQTCIASAQLCHDFRNK